jgi:transposase
MMNERRPQLSRALMNAAIATGEPARRSFVTGSKPTRTTWPTASACPWSSGAVEGHVDRIKMFKRQMYGRQP